MLSVTPVLFLSILLASTVLAAPSSRYAVRAAARRSQLNNRLEQHIAAASEATVYSDNWAGALWIKDNGTFTSVTGTFTVPAPSGEDGAAASVWVGIDGDTCTSAILQAGIDFALSSGQPSYDAWYEWYPDGSYDLPGINIFAGDIIRVTIAAYSTTSGSAMVENLTRGQTVSQNITSPYPLCQQNAEWIVEDFQLDNTLVPFANFTPVTFTNAVAAGNGTYTPYGATIVDIEQNDAILTSVSVNGSSLTVQHV